MPHEIDLDLKDTLSEKLSNLWRRFVKRPIKFFIQRRKRGFDDSELWELQHRIAEFIYPRLKAFREMNRLGAPAELCVENDDINLTKSNKIWNAKLDKMIAAFDLTANEDKAYNEIYEEIEKKEDKNKKFDFDEWFNNLNKDPYTKEERKKIDEGYERQRKTKEEGLKLFAEYFEALWD